MDQSQPNPSVGDHTLIRKISSGSYGEVWLAQNALGTYRAVKIIRTASFESLRPFQREFEGIKRFEPVSRVHDGLVDILQVGLAPEAFFYVMELADDLAGGPAIDPQTYRPRTLAGEVQRKQALPTDRCIEIGIQLCTTLAFLHERGLIHRDIKPSNIIFIDQQPKLADIGLIADIRDAKTYVGTMGFIPPEGPNSEQADIYSLGKLLYEICTGKDRHDFPALPDRAEFAEDFLELNEVLLKACHTDKDQRYRSALSMAADLKMIASGKSVRRLRYLEGHIRRIRKYGVLLAAVLSLLGMAFYAVNQNRQHARELKQRAIGSQIAQGSTLMKQGDFLGALPFFLDALKLDEQNPGAAKSHRLRIGSILAASPRIDRVWHLKERPIRACAIYGRMALITVRRQYVQVFELDTGEELSCPLDTEGLPEFATFMPDGKAILVANANRTIELIDWPSGKTLRTLSLPEKPSSVWPSPDGQRIVAGCEDGTVRSFGAQPEDYEELVSHTDAVFGVKFSPSGRFLVTASTDFTARLYDFQAATNRVLGHGDWVFSADFSPDEQLLATACYDGAVRLWNPLSGEEIDPPLPGTWGVYSVQFSPDGERILTACLDGSAKIWSRKTHQLVEANHTLRHNAKILDACFTTLGDQILTGGADGTATLWNLGGLPLRPVPMGKVLAGPPVGCALSTDQQWEVRKNGSEWRVYRQGRLTGLKLPGAASIQSVRFNSTSTKLCVPLGTNVFLVDLKSETILTLAHSNVVAFAEFSPDGSRLLCGSTDETLEERSARLWNAADGQPIGEPLQHGDGVVQAGFTADGTEVVTSSEDGTAVVWNAGSGRRVSADLEHRDKVRYASFAQTEPWVVTASDDFTAGLWDQTTGDPLAPPFRHPQRLAQAEFAAGDSAIITTDYDGNRWKWPLQFETRPVSELVTLTRSLGLLHRLHQ